MADKDLNVYSKPYLDRIKRERDQEAKRDSTRRADNKKLHQDIKAQRSPKQVCMDTYGKKYGSVDRSTESPEEKKARIAFRNNCKTKSDKKVKVKGYK